MDFTVSQLEDILSAHPDWESYPECVVVGCENPTNKWRHRSNSWRTYNIVKLEDRKEVARLLQLG